MTFDSPPPIALGNGGVHTPLPGPVQQQASQNTQPLSDQHPPQVNPPPPPPLGSSTPVRRETSRSPRHTPYSSSGVLVSTPQAVTSDEGRGGG